MIHIELLLDIVDEARAAAPTRKSLRFGCIALCLALLLSVIFGGFVMRIKKGLPDESNFIVSFGLAGILAVGCVAAVKAVFRALESRREAARAAETREILERIRAAARRFGYQSIATGGSSRHRVTIGRIEAIWPVDDLALDDLGPGYILRTADNEHVYCAGDALLNSEEDGYADGTFHLAETLVVELNGDLQWIETATCQGRRVPVCGDEVLIGTLPRLYDLISFAILDDPDLIRCLPPIANSSHS